MVFCLSFYIMSFCQSKSMSIDVDLFFSWPVLISSCFSLYENLTILNNKDTYFLYCLTLRFKPLWCSTEETITKKKLSV